MTRLRVFEDLESLSVAFAEGLVAQIREVVTRRGRCALVLTGGRTPRRTYELIGERFAHAVPWAHVDLFWGDERYVPHDDPRSNYLLAQHTFLDRVPVPAENVHPIPVHHPEPDHAAEAYERVLRDYFRDGPPRFDLLLLGMAANGHVASLFPHHPALEERTRWVVAADVPADPPGRITMTLPLINQAAQIAFLVAGATKAEAVRRALTAGRSVEEVPAAGVDPASGNVTWWLDASAAALIGPSSIAPSPF